MRIIFTRILGELYELHEFFLARKSKLLNASLIKAKKRKRNSCNPYNSPKIRVKWCQYSA
jgi:hypothetical protein